MLVLLQGISNSLSDNEVKLPRWNFFLSLILESPPPSYPTSQNAILSSHKQQAQPDVFWIYRAGFSSSASRYM